MTLTEAFEAFILDELVGEDRSQKTIDSYICTQNSLLRSIGDDILVAYFAYPHLIHWKKDMRDWDNRLTYVNQQLRNLRKVLAYLRDRGYSVLDPKYIKIPKGAKYRETAWLTEAEMRRFLSAIDSMANQPFTKSRQAYMRDKALFSMQFSSGARINELLALNCDCVDELFATKTLKVRNKGAKEAKEERRFDDNALQALADYLSTRTDDLEPLFLSRERKRPHVSTVIQSFHRYITAAGIKQNGAGATHVMRHSFGTDLFLNGATLPEVSELMGHSKVSTTKSYIHAPKTHLNTNYKKFHSPTPIKSLAKNKRT